MRRDVHAKRWTPKAMLKLTIEGLVDGHVTKEELWMLDRSLKKMTVCELSNLCGLMGRIREEDSHG